jgi:hypothetical protein
MLAHCLDLKTRQEVYPRAEAAAATGWFIQSEEHQRKRERFRHSARVLLEWLDSKPQIAANPDKHRLYRTHECKNGHKWDALVAYSKNTTRLSKERTSFCPTCHERQLYSSPWFLKDGEPWLKEEKTDETVPTVTRI